MTNDATQALKEQLVQATQRLFQAGVMSHSGHGNMSVRLPGMEHMLLASTGLHSQLTPEQVAVVTFDGEVIGGTLEARSEERRVGKECRSRGSRGHKKKKNK